MKVALVLLLLAARAAHAQECHPVAAPETPIVTAGAGLRIETAAIDDGRGRSGFYEGAIPSLELVAFGARARVALGAYHIAWGQEGTGFGDLQLGVQREVIRHVGVAMSATLPTGDVAHELGMGHPMLMPSVWSQFATERSSLLASVVYGRMLGGHEHSMPEPVVSPMNQEELAAAVRGARRLGGTELAVNVSGAIPLGMGEARAAVGVAARWRLGGTELGVELAAPFGGTPIYARGAVEVSRGF